METDFFAQFAFHGANHAPAKPVVTQQNLDPPSSSATVTSLIPEANFTADLLTSVPSDPFAQFRFPGLETTEPISTGWPHGQREISPQLTPLPRRRDVGGVQAPQLTPVTLLDSCPATTSLGDCGTTVENVLPGSADGGLWDTLAFGSFDGEALGPSSLQAPVTAGLLRPKRRRAEAPVAAPTSMCFPLQDEPVDSTKPEPVEMWAPIPARLDVPSAQLFGTWFRADIAGRGKLRLNLHAVCPESVSYALDHWPELQRESSSSWMLDSRSYGAVRHRLGGEDDAVPRWVHSMWALAGSKEPDPENFAWKARFREKAPVAVLEEFDAEVESWNDELRYAVDRGGRLWFEGSHLRGLRLALTLAYEFPEAWPVLIMCPRERVGLWRSEILRWLGNDTSIGEVQTAADDPPEAADFVLISDDLVHVHRLQTQPNGADFGCVICDGILSDPSSSSTMAAVPLVQRAQHSAVLGASSNSPADLYAPLQAALGARTVSFETYADRYLHCKLVSGRMGTQRLEELQMVLRRLAFTV